jgi:hypothetical protein
VTQPAAAGAASRVTEIWRGYFEKYPDTPDGIAIGVRLGNFLRGQGKVREAVELYERILSAARSMPEQRDLVRVNIALCRLDLGEQQQAREVLEELRGRPITDQATGHSEGLYFISAGALGGAALRGGGDTAAAAEIYQTARERAEVLCRRFPSQPWPPAYLAMTFCWRMELMRGQPNAMPADAEPLVRQFIQAVPLNRWTWQQHSHMQQVLHEWRTSVERERMTREKAAATQPTSRPSTAPSDDRRIRAATEGPMHART